MFNVSKLLTGTIYLFFLQKCIIKTNKKTAGKVEKNVSYKIRMILDNFTSQIHVTCFKDTLIFLLENKMILQKMNTEWRQNLE